MCRFLATSILIPTLLTSMFADVQRVQLWPAGVPGGPPATSPEQVVTEGGWTRVTNVQVPWFSVHPAPADRACGTGVVIVPGGGYGIVAFEHEGTDLARWFNERGITAFVLRYRLSPDRHPAPLRDVLRAIRLVRSQAGEFGVRPDRIGVIGFSAGGHLASCAATLYDSEEGRSGDALDTTSARPDFAALIYPVITLEDPLAHAGSRENLLGASVSSIQVRALSTHTRVTPGTPPLFLLHAEDDNVVPVENSLLMHTAARKAGVPVELHLFEQGGHGFGMRTNAGEVAVWPELVLGWLKQRGLLEIHGAP